MGWIRSAAGCLDASAAVPSGESATVRRTDILLLDRPVLITGPPRSGKGLLASLLSEAQEFLHVNEPVTTWNIGMRRRADDRRSAEEATPRIRRRIRAVCHAKLVRAGRRRYMDDLAHHALRIPFVTRVIPEAKVVLVVRSAAGAVPEMVHGWRHRDTVRAVFARRHEGLWTSAFPRLAVRWMSDYVHSRLLGARRGWGPRVPGQESFSPVRDTAELAAYQWRIILQCALRDLAELAPGSWTVIRLEHLLRQPETELRRLAEFIEADAPDTLVAAALRRVQQPPAPAPRAELTDEEWERVRRQAACLQRDLGYVEGQE